MAHGAVVPHPLSMREALGSIPSVSNRVDAWLLSCWGACLPRRRKWQRPSGATVPCQCASHLNPSPCLAGWPAAGPCAPSTGAVAAGLPCAPIPVASICFESQARNSEDTAMPLTVLQPVDMGVSHALLHALMWGLWSGSHGAEEEGATSALAA